MGKFLIISVVAMLAGVGGLYARVNYLEGQIVSNTPEPTTQPIDYQLGYIPTPQPQVEGLATQVVVKTPTPKGVQTNNQVKENGSTATQQGYPCTITYPLTGNTETYYSLYKTKAECDAAQASWNLPPANQQIITSTPTPQATAKLPLSTPTATAKASYNDYKILCEQKINPKYDSLIIGCSSLGDSSAARVCESSYNQERQKEINKCLQQYGY